MGQPMKPHIQKLKGTLSAVADAKQIAEAILAEKVEAMLVKYKLLPTFKKPKTVKRNGWYPNTLSQTHYIDGVIANIKDRPSKIYTDGHCIWYLNGKVGREYGMPADIDIRTGAKIWFKDGERHRDGDYPSHIYASGKVVYCKNGKIHRTFGPAIIGPENRYKAWFIEDEQIRIHMVNQKTVSMFRRSMNLEPDNQLTLDNIFNYRFAFAFIDEPSPKQTRLNAMKWII